MFRFPSKISDQSDRHDIRCIVSRDSATRCIVDRELTNRGQISGLFLNPPYANSARLIETQSPLSYNRRINRSLLPFPLLSLSFVP